MWRGCSLCVALALAACLAPGPTPTPAPTPVPGPDTPDVFSGAVVDCASWMDRGPDAQVEDCLLAALPAPCLVRLTDSSTPDAVACAVRRQSMRLHVLSAQSSTTADQEQEMRAADAWIKIKQLGYR